MHPLAVLLIVVPFLLAPTSVPHPLIGGSGNILNDLQEIGVIDSVNSSTSVLSAEVLLPVPANLTPGYALSLNAWSSTGDWYQVVIAMNYNCGNNLVFGAGYEIWNTTTSVALNCMSMTAAPGNVVRLNLSLPDADHACFGWTDESSTTHLVHCVYQPDPGATSFGMGFDKGYVTGVMSEYVAYSPSTCTDPQDLPQVTYWLSNVTTYGLYADLQTLSPPGSCQVALTSTVPVSSVRTTLLFEGHQLEVQNNTVWTDLGGLAPATGMIPPSEAPWLPLLMVAAVSVGLAILLVCRWR
jgi:hypothetical protein